MSQNYDIDRELKEAIEQALEALTNVPRIGGVYSQKYSDIQLAAHRRLQDAFDNSDAF